MESGGKQTVQQKDDSWMRNAEYVKCLYKKSDLCCQSGKVKKTERDRQFAARNRSRFRVSS